MKRIACVVVACFLVSCSGCSNKSGSLVGKWEAKKGAQGAQGMPPGATIEFTSDNKLKISASAQGMNLTMEGTYKRDGDKLTMTIKAPTGQEISHTATIKSLTDKELVLKDADGKEETLVRK